MFLPNLSIISPFFAKTSAISIGNSMICSDMWHKNRE